MSLTRGKYAVIAVIVVCLRVGLSPPWAWGTCPKCPCTYCWELQEGPGIEAELCHQRGGACYDWVMQCKQPTNPPLITARQWAEYFNVLHSVSDLDLRKHSWWEVPCVPGAQCYLQESDWYLIADPWVRLHHWEFVGAPPDLTVPGTYTLKAVFTNDLIPDPIRCNPCWCPDGTENCAACQECPARETPTIRDPDVERLFTIIVPDCCSCSPPPECHGTPSSSWTPFYPTRDCELEDNWADPPLVDDCGNKLQIVCAGAYYLLYNGSLAGTCTWRCGRNFWSYKRFYTDCGWRFHGLFHRTIDWLPPWTGPCCDRGTCGQFDWLDTFSFPCLVGPPAPPSCCAGPDFPGPDPGVSCPSPGNCDNNARCNGKCLGE